MAEWKRTKWKHFCNALPLGISPTPSKVGKFLSNSTHDISETREMTLSQMKQIDVKKIKIFCSRTGSSQWASYTITSSAISWDLERFARVGKHPSTHDATTQGHNIVKRFVRYQKCLRTAVLQVRRVLYRFWAQYYIDWGAIPILLAHFCHNLTK